MAQIYGSSLKLELVTKFLDYYQNVYSCYELNLQKYKWNQSEKEKTIAFRLQSKCIYFISLKEENLICKNINGIKAKRKKQLLLSLKYHTKNREC